jgi:phage shock protein A
MAEIDARIGLHKTPVTYLHQRVSQLEGQVAELRRAVADLRRQVAGLADRLTATGMERIGG